MSDSSNNNGIYPTVLKAFTLHPIKVGELDIHPVSMAHNILLEKYAPNFPNKGMKNEEFQNAFAILSTPAGGLVALSKLPPEEFASFVFERATKMMRAHIPLYFDAMEMQLTGAYEPAVSVDGSEKKTASDGGLKPTNISPQPTTGAMSES